MGIHSENNNKDQQSNLREEPIIFAPSIEIKNIENVINKLSQTHSELQKVKEKMKKK